MALGFGHFNLAEFLKGDYFVDSRKMYVLLHGYEYAALAFIASIWAKKCRPYFIILGLALLAHLFYDSLYYFIPLEKYFLIFRFLNNFYS
jgi:hypothetical protein